MTELRERFEIREVMHERRTYRYVSSERRYVDACIAADSAIAWWGGDWVVVDSHEGNRVLYDSRLQRAPVAGPGVEPGFPGYEPSVVPIHHPAAAEDTGEARPGQ